MNDISGVDRTREGEEREAEREEIGNSRGCEG